MHFIDTQVKMEANNNIVYIVWIVLYGYDTGLLANTVFIIIFPRLAVAGHQAAIMDESKGPFL